MGPAILHALAFSKTFSWLQVRESLTKRAREFNILLDDVAITHLSFGSEVSRAASHNFACRLMTLFKSSQQCIISVVHLFTSASTDTISALLLASYCLPGIL